MQVYTTQPYRIIYSILQHEYLGYLIESYVVQVNSRAELTLQYQSISATNIQEFVTNNPSVDSKLIKLSDALGQEVILKKFNPKKLKPFDFFQRIFDLQKGDKLLQETILNYVDAIKAQMLPLLIEKNALFIMSNDGNPIWQPLTILPEPATVLFHFMRNPENTHYFPTIKYNNQKIDFQYKNAFILCEEPAWLVLEGKVYHFTKNVDGKKIRPFLHKKFISIPKNIEEDYYRKFVATTIGLFDVHAKGFEIKYQDLPCVTFLNISEISREKTALTLFDASATDNIALHSDIVFSLFFRYGDHSFRFDNFAAEANVSLQKNNDSYTFCKIKRDLVQENNQILFLKNLNLDLYSGRCLLEKNMAFSWLQQHYTQLISAGFTISQQLSDKKQYFLGYSSFEVAISENNDWFDIFAIVRFGEFEVPFLKLKSLILSKKREFILPNGEIAVIPEVWFTHYSELLGFVQHQSETNSFVLKKHHIALVQNLSNESLAAVSMSRKLKKLQDFEHIESYDLPLNFKGTLRSYQKAGYDWLRFLNSFGFGGCLADDMGLGKTIQTLALLQSQKEVGVAVPSLLIMPTSLIYNWQLEAARFTPDLRVLVYTGASREKNNWNHYDLVLTSYGIVRIDIDILAGKQFHYVILDESQAIKNPASNIAQAVMILNSKHRLILTGTPLENSTLDIWSQLSFANPGLLGSQSFFRNEFLIPIEKYHDPKKQQRLYSLIKPFMLRRHKSQVATELPQKIEHIHYSEMSETQATAYEEAKSYFRNQILQQLDANGMGKSQIILLQGLTKLRQIANHPCLVDIDYEGDSGKFADVLEHIETIIEEHHKILIFSQFVKHLAIFRKVFDEQKIAYTYLDGSTTNRQAEVDLFQNNDSVKVFLISLKAGGLGLNLTAADYVFLLDPWWNPAIEAQAVDRAHRIGQHRTVFTYKFISKNTVEEKILTLQRNKLRLANELITTEESFVKSLTKSDILALLD